MNILLISCNPVVAPYPVYPLGMSVIAAALQRAGHAVRQFDMLAHGFSLDALRTTVAATPPALIGISFRNLDNVNACNEALYIDQLAQLITALRTLSAAPVVVGGPGFSVLPQQVLAAVGADYGIVGEGERLVVELADTLARGEQPAQRILHAPSTLTTDEMPPALYDPQILEFYQKAGSLAPVQSKRGCPYHCAYCTYPLLEGHHLRPRPCDAVIDDILALQAAGAKQIFFTDSIFNDSEGHYRNLIEAMRRRRVSIPWTAFFRPELMEPALIAAMQETGLNAIELGTDAASDETLRGLGKAFTFADVEAAHTRFVDAGLTVSHYFMMGGPNETRETVETGIANILRLRHTASFVFLGIRILPGTPLAARALREGIITPDTDLLQPAYYFSPALDRDWLHERLLAGFKNQRQVVYPPDSYDSGLAFLHRLGYSGMAIDLFLKSNEKRAARDSAKPHAG